jgi:hypothetical protein
MATGNSLESSDLKIGAFIFNEKHMTNMEKFNSGGLSSSTLFRGALLLEKKKKRAAKQICQYGDHARQDKGPPNLNT